MLTEQKKALDLIIKFIPKDFGINKAYYKASDNKLEVLFIVDEDNAANLISYLNVLPSMIEKKVKDVNLESSVYIDGNKRNIDRVAKKEKLEKIKLPTFAHAGIYA